MKPEKETHLNKKQIIQAIVEITDLPLSLQKHMLSCSECHREKVQFEQEIEQLGRKAAAYVPVSPKQVVLPLEKMGRSIKQPAQRRTSLGIAVAALFIVFIAWETHLMKQTPEENGNRHVLEMQEAEALIMEVNMLAENALPRVYLELSTEIETESDFENLFIEYIIPLTEEDSLSLKSGKKGAISC